MINISKIELALQISNTYKYMFEYGVQKGRPFFSSAFVLYHGI